MKFVAASPFAAVRSVKGHADPLLLARQMT
jgi:hypothetical protein